tara:strand:+ start:717 stop:2429 length:1713 start_codon:yes stop_codon:yes gene_type:complete
MISEEIKNKIKILYVEKKYDELIEFTKKYTLPDDRPSGLINLLGNSYYLKNDPSKEDIYNALDLFEQAYLKEKNSIHGMNAIKNYVIVGIKVSRVFKEFSEYLLKAKEFFIEAENYFDKNEEFLQTGLLLFIHLLDKKKIKEITYKILNGSVNSKDLRGQSTYMTNYFYDWSQENISNISKKNSQYYSKLKVKKIDKSPNSKNKIINLGFVSCDLIRSHSIFYFLKDTLKYLDKSKFRIFIFSLSKKDINDLSQNYLRKLCDEWFDLQEFNNQKISEIIQEKNIEILFDLVGYTNSKRIELFNSRLAPIQISWLAYCNTTGFDTVDYMLADKNLISENEYNLYSEKIIKLPDIWNAHSGFNYERKFNELKALEEKNFTFGSLNNFMKISDETIGTWSKILKKINNSILILKSSNFCSEEILMNKFKSNGVENKVKILRKANFFKHEDHLNLYKKIDLCLDTFPYNGVTTTFEALWMNVPVIVLKGNNFVSRCGESIIKNSKNDNLIAKNVDEYIAKAILFANDLYKLNIIRKNLYDNVLSSELFDTKKFSKNFGDTLFAINEVHNRKILN